MKRFVTFEGIDGSGKSTVVKEVYERMREQGFEVVLTAEPTSSEIGVFVDRCIHEDADPFVTSFAFIADRIEHCKQISRWLAEGKTVLCDRYDESTYAYQAVQLEGLVEDPIDWLKMLSEGRVLEPDITFLFVLPPSVAVSRVIGRGEERISFEKVSFLERVQEQYIGLCPEEESRFVHLDAIRPIEEIIEECLRGIIG